MALRPITTARLDNLLDNHAKGLITGHELVNLLLAYPVELLAQYVTDGITRQARNAELVRALDR